MCRREAPGTQAELPIELKLAPTPLPPDLVPSIIPRPRKSRRPPHRDDRLPERIQRPTPPPSGDVELTISLGERIDIGKSGIIFEVLVLDENLRRRLPALVAKVVRPWRRAHLGREKWFYDELWPLQGVAIPRCYGFFEAEIDASSDIWAELGVNTSEPLNPSPPRAPPSQFIPEAGEDSEYIDDDPEYAYDDEDYWEDLKDEYEGYGEYDEDKGKQKYLRHKPHPEDEDDPLPTPWGSKLDAFFSVSNRVSILLIERVGGRYLSPSKPLQDP